MTENGQIRVFLLDDHEIVRRGVHDRLSTGSGIQVVGDELHLAEKTVKNYVSSLVAKMGMERRTQAAAYVARHQADQNP